MEKEIESKVLKALNKVTGRSCESVNLENNLKSQLSLDSIQIVELFAALETEFKIELPLEMMTVKTGRAFFKILEEQLVQQKV